MRLLVQIRLDELITWIRGYFRYSVIYIVVNYLRKCIICTHHVCFIAHELHPVCKIARQNTKDFVTIRHWLMSTSYFVGWQHTRSQPMEIIYSYPQQSQGDSWGKFTALFLFEIRGSSVTSGGKILQDSQVAKAFIGLTNWSKNHCKQSL